VAETCRMFIQHDKTHRRAFVANHIHILALFFSSMVEIVIMLYNGHSLCK